MSQRCILCGSSDFSLACPENESGLHHIEETYLMPTADKGDTAKHGGGGGAWGATMKVAVVIAGLVAVASGVVRSEPAEIMIGIAVIFVATIPNRLGRFKDTA